MPMFWKQRQTILLITASRAVRIDVSNAKLPAIWLCPRPAECSFEQALASAIALTPQSLGSTWIVAHDFWSGNVSLGQDVVRSIPTAALEQAIAFELEYDSGLDPFGSRVCFIPTKSTSDKEGPTDSSFWWVVQVENQQIEAARRAVKRSRGTLAGCSIPFAFVNDADLTKSSQGRLTDRHGTHLDSLDNDQLWLWGSQWLTAVRANDELFPILRLTNHEWSAPQRQRLARVLTVCAIAASAGHFIVSKLHTRGLQTQYQVQQAEQKVLREQVEQLDQLATQANTTRNQSAQQLAIEQQKLVSARQQETLWHEGRKFPVALMQALKATAHESRCILQVVYTRQEQIEFKGLALKNEDALAFAVKLEELLVNQHWAVQSPKLNLPALGGPVHFSISVRQEAGASSPPTATAVAGGKRGV